MTTNVGVIILGKVSYSLDDASGTAIVTNDTIDQVALWVRAAISCDLSLTTHDTDTYRRARAVLGGDGHEALSAFPAYLRAIRELQIGVYHHRLILHLTFETNNLSLGRIRILRQHATNYAREVFDQVVSLSHGEGQINRIVAYPVVLVPTGRRLLRHEDRSLKKEGYSALYSTTTTTFGVQVRASRLPWDIRQHFLRVSVPGIIVYQAGKNISKNLLNAIVDAVYYGALYARAEPLPGSSDESTVEHGIERGSGATREMTVGSNELLLRVVNMLKERVSAERRYEFETALTIIGIVLTLLAVGLSGVALVISS